MIERLSIAVDCDDVLIPSTETIVRLYNTNFNTSVDLKDAHVSGNPAWNASSDEIGERIYDIQMSEEYGRIAPFDEAIVACRSLAKVHELHLVTSRPQMLMSLTESMVNEYFAGVFTKIEHLGPHVRKGEICRQLKADLLVDDNYKHLEAARQCGIPNLIWFGDYPWNAADDYDTDIVRCKDWESLEQLIGQISNAST